MFKKHRRLIIGGISVFLAVTLAILQIQLEILPIGSQVGEHSNVLTIGEQQVVLTIGTGVEAATVTDYTCDGVADDVQFQAALQALPVTGGKIEVLGGRYNFIATVAWAVDNVTIEGVGSGTYFSFNGISVIFSAGSQIAWVFRDFSTDAGGVNVSNAVRPTMDNVLIGSSWYNYTRSSTMTIAASNAPAEIKSQADYICDGTADQSELNSAITAVASTQGTIVLSAGIFHFSVVPTLADNITVKGQGSGTVVVLDDNITAFALTDISSATLENLTVWASATQTQPAVVLYANAETITGNIVSNIRIKSSVWQNFDGVLVQANGINGIYGCIVEKIEVSGVGNMLHLNNLTSAASGSWINSNTFRDFTSLSSDVGILFDGDGDLPSYGYNSNTFQDFRIEPHAALTSYGVKDVKGSRNTFINIMPWDFSNDRTCFTITTKATDTVIIGGLGYIDDYGYNTLRVAAPNDISLGDVWKPQLQYFPITSAGAIPNSGKRSQPLSLLGSPTLGTITNTGFGKITLDGATQYLSAPSVNITGDKTIALGFIPDFAYNAGVTKRYFDWVKATPATNARATIYQSTSNTTILAFVSDGGVYTTVSTPKIFSAGDFLFLVMTSDNTGVKAYINGEYIGSNVAVGAVAAGVGSLRVGVNYVGTAEWAGGDFVYLGVWDYTVDTPTLYNLYRSIATLANNPPDINYLSNSFTFPAPSVEWTPSSEGAELGENQTALCFLPLENLKLGDAIVSYQFFGDVAESTNVTLDCKLVRVNLANPITTTDIAGGAIASITTDGNFNTTVTLTAPEVVAANKQYVLQITGITEASDSIIAMGAKIRVRK